MSGNQTAKTPPPDPIVQPAGTKGTCKPGAPTTLPTYLELVVRLGRHHGPGLGQQGHEAHAHQRRRGEGQREAGQKVERVVGAARRGAGARGGAGGGGARGGRRGRDDEAGGALGGGERRCEVGSSGLPFWRFGSIETISSRPTPSWGRPDPAHSVKVHVRTRRAGHSRPPPSQSHSLGRSP